MTPGRLLRRIAMRTCASRTRILIIDALVADLQHEWSASSPGRRAVVLVRGYAAFWRALSLCALRDVTSIDMTPVDWRDVRRTIGVALILVALMTAFLTLIPKGLQIGRHPLIIQALYLFTLVAQALPVAIPIGLTFGIVLGIGRPLSRESTKVILLVAMVCSSLSFVIIGWVKPAANQALKSAVAHRLGLQYSPARPYTELTLAELNEEIAAATSAGESRRARRASAARHRVSVIACATLILTALALTLRNRYATAGRIKLTVIMVGLFGLWWVVFYVGDLLILRADLPTVAGAWMPNLLFTFYILLSTFYLRARSTT